MNFEELKALHRERRDHFDEGFSTRVHRALSWLHRAEKETEDDEKFLYIRNNYCGLQYPLYKDYVNINMKDKCSYYVHTCHLDLK